MPNKIPKYYVDLLKAAYFPIEDSYIRTDRYNKEALKKNEQPLSFIGYAAGLKYAMDMLKGVVKEFKDNQQEEQND